ncbi:hypothetical protein [Qipengyuania thermophila]|nr:hypothetical protein [Qipengyuania thermophila]
MTRRHELVANIAIGFLIGAFGILVASGPESWGLVPAEAMIAFIR